MDQDLIDFWFSEATRKLWFKSTQAFDRMLSKRYLELWEQAARGELDHWGDKPIASLALVIILDQLPLNMFRDKAICFSTEVKSRKIARAAIERGFDESLTADQQSFLYMPFMHSEDLDDQRLAIKLFEQAGLDSNLRFAKHHFAIIEKFGRFPHRNAVLGRSSSEAEIEYLNSKEAFKG